MTDANSYSDAQIAAAIQDVDEGNYNKPDLFICAQPDQLQLFHLKRQNTVINIPQYVDHLCSATANCDLRGWQSGICNTTIPNHIQIDNGFIIESISTEALRRCTTSFPSLDVIWATPYQISAAKPNTIVTIEGVSITLSRHEFIVHIPVRRARESDLFFSSTIEGSLLRHGLVIAATTHDPLRFDVFCSVVQAFFTYLTLEERSQLAERISRLEMRQGFDVIASLPGSKAAVCLFTAFGEVAGLEAPTDLEPKYGRFVQSIQNPQLDLLNVQESYLKALSVVIQSSLEVRDLSRDAIGFGLLAVDEGFLDDDEKSSQLDMVAFDLCTENDDDEVHRMSQQCFFRDRLRDPFGNHTWIDKNRATYSIEPSRKPAVTTTCDGRAVRVGCRNGIPWMYGINLATILSIARWGAEHAPFINGNPEHDMVADMKVHGQTVISLLFNGNIGARGTAFLLSQMVYGDVQISRRSRNGLAKALAKHQNRSSSSDGYTINFNASTKFVNRMNCVVLEDEPYLVFGNYLVAFLYRKNGYLRVRDLEHPHGRLEAVGRANVSRPLR